MKIFFNKTIFEVQKIILSTLLKFPNVCILPQIGFATIEARNAIGKIAAKNTVSFLNGEKMKTCVNLEV